MPVPPPSAPFTLQSLVDIMAALRDPVSGCPWDLEQDFSTIAPYTIEEAYEVADAITRQDWSSLTDELGDLLLQIVYHSQIARERQLFALDDVLASICTKMVRRHPHVFGDATISNAAGQTEAWEEMKASERQRSGSSGTLAGVALSLPALMRAEKLQRRAARAGFDWPDATGPLAKIHEELGEVTAALTGDGDVEAEIGDLLFSVVNWARHLGIAPENALRAANARFEERFARVEQLAGSEPLDGIGIERLERFWQQAKRMGTDQAGGDR